MSFSHSNTRLPSLRAIRALEAAIRLGSFTRAATELNVTQGAVSRQIQELELLLDTELFQRRGPRLRPTETGTAFSQAARQALDVLGEAVAAVRDRGKAGHVTLSMLPSVAAKWLAPRLGQWIDRHPDIDLRITASRRLVDLDAEGVDAAIRYGKGNWPDLQADLLGRETVFPVCAPDYANRLALRQPEDLLHATLLHSDTPEDWAAWFQAAGVPVQAVPKGPTLGDGTAIVQATIDGHGVALGRSRLVAEDLASGRLVAPFVTRLAASFAYWFVTKQSAAPRPDLMLVKQWIQAEFDEQPDAVA